MAGPDLLPCPFCFDRYINGVLMAEGVCVEREKTLDAAMKVAARIASHGCNGEVPVLVYRASTPRTAALAVPEVGALVAKIEEWEARIDDCEWSANSSLTSDIRKEMRAFVAALKGSE